MLKKGATKRISKKVVFQATLINNLNLNEFKVQLNLSILTLIFVKRNGREIHKKLLNLYIKIFRKKRIIVLKNL
jgi:hypothetical protein